MRQRRSYLVIAVICFLALLAALGVVRLAGAGNLIVDLPLAGSLSDRSHGVRDGRLVRTSDATYIAGGSLLTSYGSRENLIEYSDDIANSWWSLSRSENSTSGAIVANTEDSFHHVNALDNGLLTAGGTYVFSAKVKPGEVSWVRVSFRTDDQYITTIFDLANGVMGSIRSNDYAGISSVDADGYYRVWISHTIGTFATTEGVYIQPVFDEEVSSFPGDNVTPSLYVKNIQLEALPSGNEIGDDLFDQEELGAELITNGDFADWTDDDPDDWTFNGSEDANNYITEVSQTVRIVSDGTYIGLIQDDIFTAGVVYKVVVDIVSPSGTGIYLQNLGSGNLIFDTITSVGTYTAYHLAEENGALHVYRTGATDTVFDNVSVKEVTQPYRGIGDTDTWPQLAGDEAITAQNDRDFNTDIGNWTAYAGVSGTCTHSTADVGGSDDKQGLLTSSGDDALVADLPTSAMGLTSDTLYRVSMDVQIPSGNTLQEILLFWVSVDETPASYSFDLSGDLDSYVEIVGYFYMGTDVTGSLRVGFTANPTDGDLLYFDNVSIRPVDVGWEPRVSNLLEIDETADALKVTYVDDPLGATVFLEASGTRGTDLSEDLVLYDEHMLTFEAKGDALKVRLYDGSGDHYSPVLTSEWDTYSILFTCYNIANTAVTFYGMGAGEVAYIRNLTVKAIPDFALLQPSAFAPTAGATAPTGATPRFEDDGLLIEGEATNLLLYSEDIETSPWSKTSTATIASDAVGPDGVSGSAQTVTDDGTAPAANVKQLLGFSLTDDEQYTYSVFVKEGTSPNFTTGFYDSDAVAFRARTDFEWTNGVLSVKQIDVGSSGIENIGNGWWRVWTTCAASVVVGTNTHYVYNYPTEYSVTAGSPATTIFYGAQLEQSPYPTSHIPTTSCPVTRTSEAADGTYGYRWTLGDGLKNRLRETLGSELVTNGDFSSWTDDDPDGWAIREVGDSTSNITEHANGMRIIRAVGGDLTYVTQAKLTPGSLYKTVVTIDDSSSEVDIIIGPGTVNAPAARIQSAGVHKLYHIATGSSIFYIYAYPTCDTIVNSVSVKEVTSGQIPTGTLVVEWTALQDYDAVDSSNRGLITLRHSALASILYFDATEGRLRSYDGTNANVLTDINWQTDDKLISVVRWDSEADSGNGYLHIANKLSDTWDLGEGNESVFDGALDLVTYLRLSYANELPIKISGLKIYNDWITDAGLSADVWDVILRGQPPGPIWRRRPAPIPYQ